MPDRGLRPPAYGFTCLGTDVHKEVPVKRLVSLLVIGLGLAACQDTTITQPSEAGPTDIALQASVQPATTTPVAALITFTEIVEPSDIRVTGKVVHETGSVYLWTVSGELTGLFVASDPIFLHHEDRASGVGSWYMDLTAPCAGTIEGRYHSKIDPDFHGMMVGQGEGGCEGVTLKGYFTPVYPGNSFVQSFEGTWHEPASKIH